MEDFYAMQSFYVNEGKKEVHPELFHTIAKKIASSFVPEDNRGNYYSVSRSQIRRLYNEVKRYDQKLDGDPEKWKKYYPYIKMIKSKVSYNIARAIEKNRFEADVYKNLSKFILEGLDQVKDEEYYHVFAALFEAVYGFYYEKNPERKMRRGN